MSVDDFMAQHWLVVTNESDRRISGCHCGFVAEDDDCGYGDSVVRHLYETAVDEHQRLIDFTLQQRALSDVVAKMPFVRERQAEAWDEGHAAAHGYDLSEPLDRDEWEEEYPDRRNPYGGTEEVVDG